MTYVLDREIGSVAVERESAPSAKAEGKRFLVLDAWRGICAICVALYHLPLLSNIYSLPFIRDSYLFVDFFFVLSGFVIEHAYGKRIAKPADAKTFMIRRFARVWPLHAAMLLFLIVTELAKLKSLSAYHGPLNGMPFSGATSIPAVIYNLLLVNALGIYDHGTWNTPGWSISVEFYTYVLYAIVYILLPRGRAWAAVAIAILGAALLSVTSHDYIAATSDFGFFRCLYGFFVGNLVNIAYRKTSNGWKTAPAQGTALELFTIALIVAFVCLSGDGPVTMAAPLVFGIGVYVFAQECGAISKIMSTAPLRLLGTLSYSIYMVHWVFFSTVSRIAKIVLKNPNIHYGQAFIGGEETWLWSFDKSSPVAIDLLILLLLACVIGLSYLTYHYIENPGRRFFERRLLQR